MKKERYTVEKGLKYFSREEVARLVKACEKDKRKYARRNEALIKLSLYCGLRVSEVGLIKREDFNMSFWKIYCRRLKGSYSNTLRIVDNHIFPRTQPALRKYIHRLDAEHNSSPYLFSSAKGNPISRQQLDLIMKDYCQKAGIQDTGKWHFHTLKHTCGVILAESGLDIKEIQYWLGHKKVDNTLIYFQFTTLQQERMFQKLAKFAHQKEGFYL